MSPRPAPVAASSALSRYWPTALVAVALFPPLFISPVAYAEISVTLIAMGLLAAAAVRCFRTSSLQLPRLTALSLGALVGLMALRSLFVDVPMISFGGAWSSDGTVWAITSIAIALLGLSDWPPATRESVDRPALTSLFAVIALLATASSIAAWQWGSTDPSGGPPSGFTANSQLQLQLLTAGLAAATAWGILRRRELPHVLAAAICGAVIFVGMLECRSSVMLPALAVGLTYALVLWAIQSRLRPGAIAGTSTGALAAVYALVGGLLIAPGTALRAATLLDSVGNGRGTLWLAALRGISRQPVFGRGPGHSASLAGWSINGPQLDYISTSDPHSLALTIAAAGGAVAVAVLLILLYSVQRSWAGALAQVVPADRPALLAIIAGSVMLFTLGQFTFVFTPAWVLMALQTALVLGQDGEERATVRTTCGRGLCAPAVLVVAVALIASAWVTAPGRMGSTTALQYAGWSTPTQVVERQLQHVTHRWDLTPVEVASTRLVALPEAAAPALRTKYAQALATVGEAARTDARLIAARLRVWASDARQGRADLEELDRIISDGIDAGPGLGLWVAAGATFHAHYGAEDDARSYAVLLLSEPDWWRQAQASCDAETLALIERLAE